MSNERNLDGLARYVLKPRARGAVGVFPAKNRLGDIDWVLLLVASSLFIVFGERHWEWQQVN